MKVKGKLLRIYYTDKRTGSFKGLFSIFNDGHRNHHTVIEGPMFFPCETFCYYLTGEFIEGAAEETFRFSVSTRMINTEKDAIQAISTIKGFSEKTAKQIVDVLGIDIYSYDVMHLSKTLSSVKGVGAKRITALREFILDNTVRNTLYQYLVSAGLSYYQARNFVVENEDMTIDALNKNPYKMMEYGLPFEKADQIFFDNDGFPDSEIRIEGMVSWGLNQLTRCGYTRCQIYQMVDGIKNHLIKHSAFKVDIDVQLLTQKIYGSPLTTVSYNGRYIYVSPTYLFNAEYSVVWNKEKLLPGKPITENIAPYIKEVEKEFGLTYNEEQLKVFHAMETGGFSILTGGPGTGKTAVIGGLVRAFKKVNPQGKILLCAPTGRAASKMSEVSDFEAKTMHKAMNLVQWYGKDDIHQEMLDYDFIICDEMSMCDTSLFGVFMAAVKKGTTVILSGDFQQLPSVAPGQVFRDLIKSGRIPVYHLTKLVRQDAKSLIAINAERILAGEDLISGKGFHIYSCRSDAEMMSKLVQLGRYNLPLILCPIKKGDFGTYNINRMVQKNLNLPGDGYEINGFAFKVGDSVIMNENRYDLGYMNGDIGTIKEVDSTFITIEFPNKTISILVKDVGNMLPAYAITVHKAQGSEAKDLVIVLPSDSYMMASRELLYTAITRARRSITIIEMNGMIRKYIKKGEKNVRDCGLYDMLSGGVFERVQAGMPRIEDFEGYLIKKGVF